MKPRWFSDTEIGECQKGYDSKLENSIGEILNCVLKVQQFELFISKEGRSICCQLDNFLEDSMNVSTVNSFKSPRNEEYENNGSIQLSLSMIICFYLIFWKVMLF